jgi:dTMP kinase
MTGGGKLITFEGGEGAGKSTLMDKLFKELSSRGFSLMTTRAPGGTALGQEIRDLLLHKQELTLFARAELLLFLSDRAQHVDEVILPALKEGKIVLCDRFNDSTLAYQGGARGFGEENVRSLCHFATAGLEPHLTLYLDIDPELGLRRASPSKDRIESETLLFHQNIRKAYHRISEKEPARFRLIDASRSPEEVFQEAMRVIDGFF